MAAPVPNSVTMTMDDLRCYSAADLDPYTVAIGQQLCAGFTFAQLGHRNLIAAFDSLPGEHFAVDDFEIGYTAYHVLHSVLKTDTGFALAAVIGSLAEYFPEEEVVGFLVLLAERSGIPASQRPLEHQWSRLVDTFYGVLSTSTFGTVLSNLETKLPAGEGRVSTESLLKIFTSMSDAVRDGSKTVTSSACAGYVWLAAVAGWLFNLNFAVHSADSQIIHAQAGARVIFTYPSPNVGNSDQSTGQPASNTDHHSNGGRVAFENFFESCFGSAAMVLREKALAACVCSGLILVGAALQNTDTQFHSIFLSPEIGPGTSTFKDRLLAWFPEIGRKSTHFGRYDNLDANKARDLFDDATQALTEKCACSTCTGTHSDINEFCKATLAEFIITMGLYISPMVVAPKLYPKRNGVLAIHAQCHRLRLSGISGSNLTPSQAFMASLGSRLPSATEMLRVSVLLFANAEPMALEPATQAMGITSTGLTVFLTSLKPAHHNPASKAQLDVNVMISPGWMCLSGHEARLEIYESTYMNWSFSQQWQEVRFRPTQIQQIVKWRGRVMVSSLVIKGGKEEAQAKIDKWILI